MQGVIPQGGKIDVPGIRADTKRQPKHPWHRKAKDTDKTDVFVKWVVRSTSPDENLGERA